MSSSEKVTKPDSVNERNEWGQTALHLAVEENETKEIQRLLSLGAEIDARDKNNQTPLLLAAYRNEDDSHFHTIKTLLENGANVNAQDDTGYTSTHYLAIESSVEMLRLLMSYKADLSLKNNQGEIPLFDAARGGNFEVMRLLLDHGLDIDSTGSDGSTPFHLACRHNVLKTMKFIAENGANVNALDNMGYTPTMRLLIHHNVHLSLEILEKALGFLLKYTDTQVTSPRAGNILSCLENNPAWKMILRHFAKLQALYVSLSQSILDVISKSKEFREYFEECLNELALAKKTKIHDSWITFFNLLVDSKKKLKNYASNQDLVEDFEKHDCKSKFPVYGDEIQGRLKKAIKNKEIFDKSAVILSDCLPVFNSNHVIVKDIFDCLGRKNLSKFAVNKRKI